MIDEMLELLAVLSGDNAGLDYFATLKKTFCRYCNAEIIGVAGKYFRHTEDCPVARARRLVKEREGEEQPNDTRDSLSRLSSV